MLSADADTFCLYINSLLIYENKQRDSKYGKVEDLGENPGYDERTGGSKAFRFIL